MSEAGAPGQVRVHLRIVGKVQGVFFRESARREAEQLGVRGWVRNLPTGEVEAVVEGAGAQVDAFVRWCRRGPPCARVDQVEVDVQVTTQSATSEFSQFEVRR